MRAPYNVLVIPYISKSENPLFCIFKRADMGVWQFIAGGGETGEDALSAARRESFEEAAISSDHTYNKLESMCYVSVDNFSEKARKSWGKRYVIPVFTFSVKLDSCEIRLSDEHTTYSWCTYQEAKEKLHFDLDKTALYELNQLLLNAQ